MKIDRVTHYHGTVYRYKHDVDVMLNVPDGMSYPHFQDNQVVRDATEAMRQWLADHLGGDYFMYSEVRSKMTPKGMRPVVRVLIVLDGDFALLRLAC